MRFMAAIYSADVPLAMRFGAAVTPTGGPHDDVFIDGCIAAIDGRDAAARGFRAEVERRAASARRGWYHVGMIDGLLGDAAEATTHVAQSFAQHESVCSLGAVDPSYDRVRGDARFRAVVGARWVCRTSAASQALRRCHAFGRVNAWMP